MRGESELGRGQGGPEGRLPDSGEQCGPPPATGQGLHAGRGPRCSDPRFLPFSLKPWLTVQKRNHAHGAIHVSRATLLTHLIGEMKIFVMMLLG